MEEEHFLPRSEHKSPRIVLVGEWLAQAFREAREQLSTADLNPHEGRLRASIAPIEVPDYPPESDV